MCVDSGSTNRAYRMPHTSMINITFGEERREAVLQQQKQSSFATSTPNQRLVFHHRTSRPVTNGNGKQQQQQPVYKVLQHPRHSESSSPGHQRASRPPQVTTSVSLYFFVFVLVLKPTIAFVLTGNGPQGNLRNTGRCYWSYVNVWA